MTSSRFDEFFEQATGFAPYEYQRQLGEAASPPSILEIPTGAGKTQALITSWLYGRRGHGASPRRLVYALPMRTLVEQTAAVAENIRSRLSISDDELAIHVLMGGSEPTDWREHPERDQILVGTIDMLLSRALNRGYAESRFAWPVSFGLLNADARWVIDEVQLMGPARTTTAQLDGLRRALGVALPVETVWASATVDRDALVTVDRPELGSVLSLAARDRAGALERRLRAVKRVERVDLTTVATTQVPRDIARAVLSAHRAGTRSIIVLNRVELAQRIVQALDRETPQEGPERVLLHARFRPPERRVATERALAPVDPGGPGVIVVATQVIEAGVDVSSALLATETAPFSSVVQRLGRCNREAELDEALVLWLDRGSLDARAAAPYRPDDLEAAGAAIAGMIGQSASPLALEAMDVPESREEPVVLRRRDLIDLFDTSPDLSGTDVDVAPFIRDDDERSISIFFRDLDTTLRPIDDQPTPDREELVTVPVGATRERAAWILDYIEGLWRPARGEVAPAAVVMLAAAEGGYDERRGWTGDARDRVEPISPRSPELPTGIGSDELSVKRQWVTLARHLADATREGERIVAGLDGLDGPRGAPRAVVRALALHDVGKSHPVFQDTLLRTLGDADRDERADVLWAKSAGGGARHARPHFRHELASALAMRAPEVEEALGDGDLRHLVLYLVAAHHGRVRLSIRPAADERPPSGAEGGRFALGVVDGDFLPPVETPLGTLPPTTLDLSCMELGGGGRSWTAQACALRDDPRLGPFRLAFFEALVRIGDWRASG